MALKFSIFIASTAASNFSVLNKSPPSVLPAFSHILFERLAWSSMNFRREGSPPTQFSASETVTSKQVGNANQGSVWTVTSTIKRCCQRIRQYYCFAVISKLLTMQLPFYAVISGRNKNDRSHHSTIPNMCIKMFTMHSFHHVHQTNAHSKGCYLHDSLHQIWNYTAGFDKIWYYVFRLEVAKKI